MRQHVGDYALFMTGVFREHVERRVGASYYVRQGQRAYQAVADFERSALRPEAPLFSALAAGFERYAAALAYLKRVYCSPGRLPARAPARAAAPDPMVAAALDALVGGEPADEAVEAALATIPPRGARGRRSGGSPASTGRTRSRSCAAA